MYQIKFGTDGWRGIIAAEFTVDNVKRVAQGTADYIKKNNADNLSIVLGHDCRFAGELFAETVAQIMCANGIKVMLAKNFVSTPMISLGAVKHGAALGVIITASHNPPAYSGYKLKAHYGGPSSPAVIDEVENAIPNNVFQSISKKAFDDTDFLTDLKYIILNLIERGLITFEIVFSHLFEQLHGKFSDIYGMLYTELTDELKKQENYEDAEFSNSDEINTFYQNSEYKYLNIEPIDKLVSTGMITYVDLETLYINEVKNSFDLAAIKNSGMKFGYDAMYGAGQNVMRALFPEATLLHCDYNPSFFGQAPEPIHKNLAEFSNLIKTKGDIDCGLVTDGDADRIGLYNKKGEFVDSHHIILLLVHYLHKYKNMDGKVITTFSATSKITALANAYGLPIEITKIGFKYICEKMVTENVLVGGEESGGIAIKGFIPERDGIWIGLTLWEFMAKTGKSLDELIQEVYDVVGSFAMGRIDLHITEEIKQNVLANCKAGKYTAFENYTIEKTEDLDGFKFHLGNGEWVMIRASGTEPVLRVYSESSTQQKAEDILQACKTTILA